MAAGADKKLTQDEVQSIARALADPRRYDILKRISEGGDAMRCSAMRECVGVSAATLSHHMKELEGAGLVEATRDGRFVHYKLRRDVLRSYLDQMREI